MYKNTRVKQCRESRRFDSASRPVLKINGMKNLIFINSCATLVLLVAFQNVCSWIFCVSAVVWVATIVPICIRLDRMSEERRCMYRKEMRQCERSEKEEYGTGN